MRPVAPRAGRRSTASEAGKPGTACPTRGWLGLVVVAGGLAAYLSSFGGAFILDDQHAIVENEYVRRLWPITEAMSAPPQSSVSGRPLAALTLAVNHAMGGLNPWGYHALNLTFHLLSGLLLFGLVRRTLSFGRLRERYGRPAPLLAMVIALLWVVHPLQTETVTYVIQRSELLMGFFYLLTLYCAIRGYYSPHPVRWPAAAVLACASGMGCKEVMATAPLLVLVHDLVFTPDPWRSVIRRRLPLYAGLAATWLILGALVAGGPRSASAGFGMREITPLNYALSEFGVILHYLKLSFWPHPLCLDYGWPIARTAGQIGPPMVAILALVAVTVWALSRRSPAGYLGVWFFVILAPTSSFIPILDLAFEHRMYLPLAAVIGLVVLAVHRLGNLAGGQARAGRRVVWGLSAACPSAAAIALGVTTHHRNLMYHDPLGIWQQTVNLNPANAPAHMALGLALVERGKPAEAAAQYEEALRLKPDFADAHYNLGNLLLKQSQYAAAETEYRAALQVNPDHLKAHLNLGAALVALGRAAEAVPEYEMALRLERNSSEAECNLAVALAYAGRIDEAIPHLREASRLAPNDAATRCNLASLLLQKGEPGEAVGQLTEAVRLLPRYPQARRLLGQALLQTGRLPEAAEQFREALRLDPGDAKAQAALDDVMAKINPSSAPPAAP